ncbi:MAG: 3' terminal RNA ribose 2'-O-methyltransferase Hen1 [Myxococcota bacterium]
MLLTITTTHQPATDLGFLLSKHPDRVQTFSLSYGNAHVFYPEASEERCTAALLLDFDPVGLIRGRRRPKEASGTLAQYVNDRPYVASSFLSVAIGKVFRSAMNGSTKGRPELVDLALPFEVELSAVPCRGGEHFLLSLFEPLGYDVTTDRIDLDERFPEWGEGNCFRLRISGSVKLADLLSHLYVLLPVLDNRKHYWVGDDEVEKLLDKAGEWLRLHPAREEITRRYLKHKRSLYRDAMERLMAGEDPEAEANEDAKQAEEEALERPISLNDQRLGSVVAVLKDVNAQRVLDLGCGEGKLLNALLKDTSFTKIAGVDVSMRVLEIAADRLKLDRMPEMKRRRIELFQSSLTYRDARFGDYDAACAIEVIEHIDPSRLGAFERVVFEFAKPPVVLLTTPNVEYNVRFDSLPAGSMRHGDHRFEWSRAEFETWAQRVGERHGYHVRFLPIGPADPVVGSPTQMGIFQR